MFVPKPVNLSLVPLEELMKEVVRRTGVEALLMVDTKNLKALEEIFHEFDVDVEETETN